MHCSMTLTFSNTVFENCDSILVLLIDYNSLSKKAVRYLLEVTPPYPKDMSYFYHGKIKISSGIA